MEMSSLENQFLIAMPTIEDGCFDKTVTYICEHNDEGAMGLIINSPLNISLVELLGKVDFSRSPETQGKVVNADEVKPQEARAEEERVDSLLSNYSDRDFQENVTAELEEKLEEEFDEDVELELIRHLNKRSKEVNADASPLLERAHAAITKNKDLLKDKLEQLVLLGGPLDQERGFVLHTTQHGWQSSIVISDDLMITSSKDILLSLGTESAPEFYVIALGHASWAPGQLEEELQENLWLTTAVDTDIIFNTPIEQRWKKATASLGIDIAHLSSDVGHA
jgi:putative transcriptional regulator